MKTFFLLIITLSVTMAKAQQFISKAAIEYEVKANLKKTTGGSFLEMIDDMPQYKTGYYDFTFADNKSICKFDHWDDQSKRIPDWLKKSDEENFWYCDYNTGIIDMQKNFAGTDFNIEDSIPKLEWKITNESRVIAGFNCRKAVTKIFDSVYVFAFYTDEIMLSGGPASINGLPGMILGVTIPRLYTSWIATKILISRVNVNLIKPVSAKKNYSMKNLQSFINERTKNWYNNDADDKAENKQQKARFIWTTLL